MTVLASLRTRGPAIDTGILPLRPFLATVFSIDAMTMLVIIAYGSSYLINVLHSPPSYPAYALGIFGFMKLLSAPISGRLLDRFPARFVVTLAVGLSLTGLAAMIAWHSTTGYLVGVAFLSYGVGTFWLVMFHVLGLATEPAVRARVTSYMALVSGGATATGFATGGLIALTDYWWAAFVAGATLAASAGILLRIVVNLVVSIAGQDRRPPEPDAPPSDPPAPIPPRLQLVAAGTGLIHSAALGGVGGIFGPFVLHTLDLELIAASLLLLPAILVGGVSMWFAGRHSRPGRRLRELALFYGIGALGLVVLASVHHWYEFMGVALALGVSLGGATPIMGATMLDVSYSGERKASVLGWLFFAQGIGTVGGPLLVGVVISLLGVREAVAVLSLFEACFVGLLLVTYRLERL